MKIRSFLQSVPSIPTLSNNNQTICQGVAITPMVVSNANATLGVTGLPAGLSYNASTQTISGSPTATGTLTFMVNNTNNCGTQSVQGKVISNVSSVVTLTNVDQTICLGSDIDTIVPSPVSVNFSGLPAGTIYRNRPPIGVSGTPTQTGVFNYTAALSTGCGVGSGTITVDAPVHAAVVKFLVKAMYGMVRLTHNPAITHTVMKMLMFVRRLIRCI